jgi:hypothetical protein
MYATPKVIVSCDLFYFQYDTRVVVIVLLKTCNARNNYVGKCSDTSLLHQS